MNKSAKYYEGLPDFMALRDIESEIFELFRSIPEDSTFLIALDELSSRYVDSMEKIDSNAKKIITEKIISLWDSSSLENTELVISVVINFELKEAMVFLKSSLDKIANVEVKGEILEVDKDLGGWARN